MRYKSTLRLFSVLSALLVAISIMNTPAQTQTREWPDLQEREEFSQGYQLSPGARVEVSFILGSVEIETGDYSRAEVYIVRSARRREDLERYDRINIEHTPTRLVLRGEDSKSGGIEIRHRVVVKLPRQINLTVNEVNGRVRVGSIDGTVRLSDVNGGAEVAGSSDRLELIGINGGVILGIARLTESGIHIRDINGQVMLRLSEGLNAELEVKELDGRTVVENAQVTLQRVGKSHFRGPIGAGGKAVISVIDVHGNLIIRGA